MSTNKTPLVSIIISNHNGRHLLSECLSSLSKLDYKNYEVIVVDAGSNDGAPDMVRNRAKVMPNLRLLECAQVGIGEAINKGITIAKGDIIVFDLNSDEVVAPDWLEKLLDVLLSSSEIGIVSGTRICYGSDIVESVGGKISFFGRISNVGQGLKFSELPKTMADVDYVPLLMFRRSLLDQIGLCCETYVIYTEDVEFCVRARSAGYRIVAVPLALTFHIGSATIGEFSPRKLYFDRRNIITMHLTHFPLRNAFLCIFWTLIQTTAEALIMLPPLRRLVSSTRNSYLVKRATISHLKASLNAVSWNMVNMRTIAQTRMNERARASVSKRTNVKR